MYNLLVICITLPLVLAQIQPNLVMSQQTNVVTERVATSCFQHSDCIRYCSVLRSGVTGPSCCFAEKTTTAKGVLLTGSDTCYCCSWPVEFTPTGSLKDDNDNGCRAYMKNAVTTTALTKEFCGSCKEAVMIDILELQPPTSSCPQKTTGGGGSTAFGDLKRFRSFYVETADDL